MSKNEISIFWNHVGREHGFFYYAPEIKNNNSFIKNKKIQMCIQRCKTEKIKNRFIKYSENILIEIPNAQSNDDFIIVYYIDLGLQFSLNHKKKYNWWLIDIVDIEEIEPNIYCVHDLFIDIALEKDGTYRIMDMDEFYYAYSIKALTNLQTIKSIKSFSIALELIHTNNFPLPTLETILFQYQSGILNNKKRQSTIL